jgi:hypothetical protein
MLSLLIHALNSWAGAVTASELTPMSKHMTTNILKSASIINYNAINLQKLPQSYRHEREYTQKTNE